MSDENNVSGVRNQAEPGTEPGCTPDGTRSGHRNYDSRGLIQKLRGEFDTTVTPKDAEWSSTDDLRAIKGILINVGIGVVLWSILVGAIWLLWQLIAG